MNKFIKKLKIKICSIFGHTNPVCPNGCFSHGFCKRCDYFRDKNGKWYENWEDSPN